MRSLEKLSNKSQKEISTTCNWIGNNFSLMFPERIISPKLHMLIVHVPQFAQKYNNLGLYSESAFESVHGEMNKLEQVFANVTDREKSLGCILTRAELKRQNGFGRHSPAKRMCSKCGKHIAQNSEQKCKCKRNPRKNSAKRRKIGRAD
jgi:hypothetical protein